ncbi:MAG TPA: TetR/AcrR family transcriptional regulator [Chloroflexota bacterium]|jgi:AcrR family transcriptional regulator|nr:TetR/AcrR family transcriptional regulator [Chloroflexota bacterium]
MAVGVEAKRGPGRPRRDSPSPEYLARQDLILQTAAQIFAARGYDGGTLEDVAEALGMRKASLYHYVRSKQDLLAQLFVRAFEKGVARLEEVATTPNPAERLVAILRVYVDEMADHPGLVAAFAGGRPHFGDQRDDEFDENDRRMVSILERAVADAVQAEALPPVDPRYGALAIIGMVSCVHRWYDSERDQTPEAIAGQFARLLGLVRSQTE